MKQLCKQSEAIKLYTNCYILDHNNLNAQKGKGICALKIGKFDLAIECFN